MLALAWLLTGHGSIAPVVGIFSARMLLAGMLYAINLWMTLSHASHISGLFDDRNFAFYREHCHLSDYSIHA